MPLRTRNGQAILVPDGGSQDGGDQAVKPADSSAWANTACKPNRASE